MRRAAAAAGVAVALSAAACGGAADAEPTLLVGAEPARGRPAEGPGRAVLAFVEAAAAGDARTIWDLLSEPTREAWGPTFDRFARETAPRIIDDFDEVEDMRVHLSRNLGGEWGVGALVGRYVPEDDEPEPTAYAAAVRREDGGWRVELGGVVVANVEPGPQDETGPRPVIAAEAEAGGEISDMAIWVDGTYAAAPLQPADPFTARLRGVPDADLPAGTRVVVVFAATGDAAGAIAWPFEVED